MPTQLDRTPQQAVRHLQAVLGLSAKELAFVMDTDQRTVDRWSTGDTFPQREARGRLAELVELSDTLAEVFTDAEGVREWLAAPSRYLRGARPIDMIRGRRPDLARTALEALRQGIFI